MKDKFTVIHNPSNWVFKYEVWVSGPVPYVDSFGNFVSNQVTKCFRTCRTKEEAESVIQYQEEIAKFKEAA